MDKPKLFEALDGLMAYDTGCTDSGINDESLKVEVKDYLNSFDENEFRLVITEFVRIQFVSEAAVEKGYGIEDVNEFIQWLYNSMDIAI